MSKYYFFKNILPSVGSVTHAKAFYLILTECAARSHTYTLRFVLFSHQRSPLSPRAPPHQRPRMLWPLPLLTSSTTVRRHRRPRTLRPLLLTATSAPTHAIDPPLPKSEPLPSASLFVKCFFRTLDKAAFVESRTR